MCNMQFECDTTVGRLQCKYVIYSMSSDIGESLSLYQSFLSSQHNANSYKHGDRDNVHCIAVTQVSQQPT